MKRLTVSFAAMLVLIFLTSGAFAESGPSRDPKTCAFESANTILGRLVSVDHARNAIVVEDQATNSDRTIIIGTRDTDLLKKDSLVKIVLAPGSADRAGYVEPVQFDVGK
jgi:hypothetical protein